MMHKQLREYSIHIGTMRHFCGRLGRLPQVAAYTDKPSAGWLHFFLSDYQFEAVWTNPLRYARRWLNLQPGLDGLVGFDFSMFDDYPPELNAWNAYRSVLLTDFMARLLEVPALPVAGWWRYGDNFQYLEEGTAVAVGSFPLKRGDQAVYLEGLARLLAKIRPSELHIFGNQPPAECLRGLPFYRYDLFYHQLNRRKSHEKTSAPPVHPDSPVPPA